MAFQFAKNFDLRWKRKIRYEVSHSRDCNLLGAPRIHPGHFPVVYSLSQISPNQITSRYILLPKKCQCCNQGAFGGTCNIATVYLSGTEEPSSWLGALSVKSLEFKASRSAKNAFSNLA